MKIYIKNIINLQLNLPVILNIYNPKIGTKLDRDGFM